MLDAGNGICGPTYEVCSPGANQVCIVGGFFDRGSDASPDTSPVQTVFVQTFWMDRYETTVADYRRCVALGDCTLPAGIAELAYYRNDVNLQRPVIGLTHDQMQTYCRSRGLRLPTETEWERAARGSDGRRYPWGEDAPACGGVNFNGCEFGAAVVGTHSQDVSGEGVYDLLGNVVEATSDRWEEGGYATYVDVVCNPSHPPRTSADFVVVTRGCSWRADPSFNCTGFARRLIQRFAGTDDVGFRCVGSQ